MENVGVVLSGCGVYDGAEIHEAVLTLLALSEAGLPYQCMAPDIRQRHVVNHLTGEEMPGETRDVLVEAARIARGDILSLSEVQASDYSAFMFPGGFGAAKNLSSFAFDGADCRVDPEVERLVREAHMLGKPLAFICIAPVLAAKVLGQEYHARVTIGNEAEAAAAIDSMGARHTVCPVEETVIDRENRIISSPAYMLAGNLSDLYGGIRKTVNELKTMLETAAAAV